MTTLTDTYGWPKPELTDLVTNGWDAIADLAEAIETTVSVLDGNEIAARLAGDAARVALATIVAAGDLLVGTGPAAVARLPKGANGDYLSIVGGVLTWIAPPATDLSSRVAKVGDTMTGDLTINKADAALLLQETVTDRIKVQADTGQQYVQVDDELHVCGIGSTIGATPKTLRAGAVYDTGNRVYSASNPPPAGGAVINQTIRGSAVTSSAVANVTIAAVVMAKTQLRWLGSSAGVPATSGPTGAGGARLSTTTNVECQPSGTSATQFFELTEWT